MILFILIVGGQWLVVFWLTTHLLLVRYRDTALPRSIPTIEALICLGLGLVWPVTLTLIQLGYIAPFQVEREIHEAFEDAETFAGEEQTT